MQKIITPISIIFIALLLSSCAGYRAQLFSESIELEPKKRLKKPQTNWETLTIHESPPDTAYMRIAAITLTSGYYTSQEKLYKKLRKEASRYNADAIVITEQYEVYRKSFNGVLLTTLILDVFTGGDIFFAASDAVNVKGEYITPEYTAYTIRYLE